MIKLILCGSPLKEADEQKEMQLYCFFRDKIANIDKIDIKGRIIIIPTLLHNTGIKQLHINYMGIQRTRLLAQKSIYWINMNTDIGEAIKNYSTCLDFQAT